jgi:integrase/recombinase XerD
VNRCNRDSASIQYSTIEQFQKFTQEYDIEIDEVKTYNIIDWMDELLSDGYARRTIRENVYSLSGYYEYLKRREIIDENPASDVDLEKFSDAKMNKEEKIRYISQEEYRQLLDTTHKTRNEVLIRLIWETGMRAQEVSDLRISDINRDNRHIEFRETKNRKDQVSTRDVYYTRSFKSVLRKWLDKGGRDAYIGVDDSQEEYLLVSRQAPKMRTERISDVVRERAEEAGVQETVYTDQRGRERKK